MWNSNIKVINITEMVQMVFKVLFGYFEYVSYLPRGITSIILNISIWSLSTSTGISNCGASSNKKSPAQTSQTTLTSLISCSPFSIHCTNTFSHFGYLSWNNTAWYAENFASFLPSSIVRWLYKNLPILMFFFSNACWYESCHNLTKLFRMKIKTSATRAILQKKNLMNLLAHPAFIVLIVQ